MLCAGQEYSEPDLGHSLVTKAAIPFAIQGTKGKMVMICRQ